MPRFLSNILSRKDTAPVNRCEGFQRNGAVVQRDRRRTVNAGFPDAEIRMGDDPLAIYKPTAGKQFDAAKTEELSRLGGLLGPLRVECILFCLHSHPPD